MNHELTWLSIRFRGTVLPCSSKANMLIVSSTSNCYLINSACFTAAYRLCFRGAALLYLHVQGFFMHECFSLTSEPICSCVHQDVDSPGTQTQIHTLVMPGNKQAATASEFYQGKARVKCMQRPGSFEPVLSPVTKPGSHCNKKFSLRQGKARV